MTFVDEAFDVLTTLSAERGRGDPTFLRMLRTYREVSDLLECRAAYDLMLRGVLAAPQSVAK